MPHRSSALPAVAAVVVLNAFAQVLIVSAAEVVVCWAVVGATVEALLKRRGRAASIIGATLVASILFGAYHFSHSAPFNTPGMVMLLAVVGPCCIWSAEHIRKAAASAPDHGLRGHRRLGAVGLDHDA